MDVELRHLRCLVAIVDTGGFTGAAAELGVTQPSVSRAIAALEDALGVRVLRRTSREVLLTTAGERVLARARRVLAEVEDLVGEARSGHTRLRLGHAWAALGAHTVELQRRWAATHPDVSLQLVRTNTPTGGLAEGACDIAVVRSAPGPARLDRVRFDSAVVGLEARYCALATDDPLARRRQLRLAHLADRVVAIDPRTGTTTVELWPPDARPDAEEIHDVDDWLAVIAGGRCVGVTAESTLTQYRRHGVVFRRLRDAPPVPVRLVWWRDDPHPATTDVVGLLAELYRRRVRTPAGS
ncbi:DNA-binding transcriptional LysR family regulator [Pseudonocardia hierapolitana]|uniref:DNA-binding transcriptional LysR family regulator n=1 Tax=Pseudonocardia hierapolitana TaxID=1128676 RepID=A0A561T0Z8_9PSEU|nr:LysR family transcriptional regulator [Pseudonocardia hierapolitana]TWF80792.1 DNA-binding transcriptional LysR family regulator [Pseudonocardia hierapolitana]